MLQMLQCYMFWCYSVTVLQRYHVTNFTGFGVTVIPSYSVTMLQMLQRYMFWCYSVTVLQCYHVTNVTVLHVLVLQCYHVTNVTNVNMPWLM